MTPNTGQGAISVPLSGTGAAPSSSCPDTLPAVTAAGWQRNGSASVSGSAVQLTPATATQAGSVIYTTAQASAALRVCFTADIGTGTGADGMTLLLLNPAAGGGALGAGGSGTGYGGLAGYAVALDTYDSGTGDPSGNFVGIADSGTAAALHYLSTSTAIPTLHNGGPRQVEVAVVSGRLQVKVAGVQVLDTAVSLPANVLVGFSAGTGGLTDRHLVSAVKVGGGGGPAPASLAVAPASVAFGSVTTGTSATANVVLTNTGGSSLTLSAVTLPAAPFSADAPVLTAGTVIPAGGSVTQVVRFSPTAVGLVLGRRRRDAEDRPGRDQRAPVRDRRRHGAGVPRRRPRERRLRLGDDRHQRHRQRRPDQHRREQPDPLGGDPPGRALQRRRPGPHGRHGHPGRRLRDPGGPLLTDRGRVGVGQPRRDAQHRPGRDQRAPVRDRRRPLLELSRHAARGDRGRLAAQRLGLGLGLAVQLTPATATQAGSVIYTTAQASAALRVCFTADIGTGTGADGMTLLLLNPAAGGGALGAGGSGMGYGGLAGYAVALDTYDSGTGDPSGNFVGIADSGTAAALHYLSTSTAIPTLHNGGPARSRSPSSAVASRSRSPGTQVLDTAVSLPANVLVGFSAGTGGLTDRHLVSAVKVGGGP